MSGGAPRERAGEHVRSPWSRKHNQPLAPGMFAVLKSTLTISPAASHRSMQMQVSMTAPKRSNRIRSNIGVGTIPQVVFVWGFPTMSNPTAI